MTDWHKTTFLSILLCNRAPVTQTRSGAEAEDSLPCLSVSLSPRVSRGQWTVSRARSALTQNLDAMVDGSRFLWVNVCRGISGYEGLGAGGGGAFSHIITLSGAALRVHARTHRQPRHRRTHARTSPVPHILLDLLQPFNKLTRFPRL